MISLNLQNVSKNYGDRNVFSGINISLESGCLVVTGANGSGKSTLLKIMSGLLRQSSGEVTLSLDGEKAPLEDRKDLVGLVAPDLTLYEELSAIENLRFFTRVRGINPHDATLKRRLAEFGLEGREHNQLSSYSSGMKQRVKYCFATIHDPPILLLDEPFSNLDESGISCVSELINRWRSSGAVVLATNDKSDIAFADQILRLGD